MTELLKLSSLALPERAGTNFKSNDVDEVREALSRAVAPHDLSPARRSPIAAKKTTLELGSLTIFQIEYGAPVVIAADGCGPYYLVKLPVGGSARISSSGQVTESNANAAAVLNPDRDLTFEYGPDCAHLVLCIDSGRLERHCAHLIGEGAAVRPIHFDLRMDLTGAPGQRWLRMTDYLVREAISASEGAGIVASPLAFAPFEQMVMTTLLATHSHDSTEVLQRPVASVFPRAVVRAEEFMQAHADWPLTPADIAAAAGTSERALFRTFREFRGESPMSRLRSIRLDRVHAELRGGSPDVTSVTEVALRWGFTHLGHFGQAYKQRFGEPPISSLRSTSVSYSESYRRTGFSEQLHQAA